MTDFKSLKSRSGAAGLASLSAKLAATESKGYKADTRYWKLGVDKAGVGSAVIRFLPAPAGEEMPYVKKETYSFKNERTGRHYIETSRQTIGQADPVQELWSTLYNNVETREQAKQYSRSIKYIANILVVTDRVNPENNGKNFLFEFGPAILRKITGVIEPEFDDVEKFDPFDAWLGANFKLKCKNDAGRRTYAPSEFDANSPIFGTAEKPDDKKIEALWNAEYSLAAEIAPDKIKSYDELKNKLNQVLGGAPKPAQASHDDDEEDEAPAPRRPASAAKATPARARPAPVAADDEDEEENPYEKLLHDEE